MVMHYWKDGDTNAYTTACGRQTISHKQTTTKAYDVTCKNCLKSMQADVQKDIDEISDDELRVLKKIHKEFTKKPGFFRRLFFGASA